MNKLLKILPKFKKIRILVVGDLILDEFIWGSVERISPEAPVPVVRVKSQSFMPGGASNVANNIKALGATVFMVGVAGADSYGDILKHQLQDRGINTDGLITDGCRQTTLKTRVIAHNQQVVRIDKEDSHHINSRILKKISSYILKKIPKVDAVIIEDYGKGVITPQLLSSILKEAKKQNKIVTIDPKEQHLSYYKKATCITPNKYELEKVTHVKIEDATSLKKAANIILKKLELDSILVTLGEDGMCLFEKGGKATKIPTMAQEVYDVSGAGDTVISAFTLALASKANMKQAALMSNCAAGVVVGKVGVAVCLVDELRKKIIAQNKKEVKK
ncbi:MAG: D-glycero-beta-D-manno-heptose-7-phosphate kinase [Candidatus Kappaea frigidicola]|nr:D-glycero-beta-D-manno-heptose-7-phosphate kinase [Candidatus Kappaea frigidicola]